MKTKTKPIEKIIELSTYALVGQFFHSIDFNKEGRYVLNWQGYIASHPEPGWYLVQLFSWVDGSPKSRRLVRIEDMRSWFFYPTQEAWHFSYKHGEASQMHA